VSAFVQVPGAQLALHEVIRQRNEMIAKLTADLGAHRAESERRVERAKRENPFREELHFVREANKKLRSDLDSKRMELAQAHLTMFEAQAEVANLSALVALLREQIIKLRQERIDADRLAGGGA